MGEGEGMEEDGLISIMTSWRALERARRESATGEDLLLVVKVPFSDE
jgi:hypothetical protein